MLRAGRERAAGLIQEIGPGKGGVGRVEQFYCRVMSGYTSKGSANHSTSFRSRPEATAPTVHMAINRLKFQQDKLLEEHKRNRVLNRHISKEQVGLYNREKQSQHFAAVKSAARRDLELKQRHQARLIEEQKHRYSLNMRHREQHKQMIESVRQSFLQANHQLYEHIRQKKQENEDFIRTERAKHMNSRVLSRVSANESKDLRRRSIQNFHESRSSERRAGKSQEIAEMLRRSEEKHKLYDVLLSRNSRIREDKLQTSRLSSARSEKNPENATLTA